MPSAAQLRQVGRRDAVRVGLGRHLGAFGDPELRPHRVHHRDEVTRRQQGRRPPAEEDRVDRYVDVPDHLPGEPDLVDRRLGVRRPGRATHVTELGCGVGVEVAVAAAHRAERHVDVEAERPRPDALERGLRQRTVSRRGFTLRQHGRHPSILPAGPPLHSPGSGLVVVKGRRARRGHALPRDVHQQRRSQPCW